MTNRKNAKSNIAHSKKSQQVVSTDDTPISEKRLNPQAVLRFAAKLPPAQRKKFLDTFNTLYIEEN